MAFLGLTRCFLGAGPGGVSPSERGLAWRFLFGMYPCGSTALERSLLQQQLVVRYHVMKRRWQRFLPSAVQMHLNGTDGETTTVTEISIPLVTQASLLSSWVGGCSRVLQPEAGAGPAAGPGPVRGHQGKTGLSGAPGTSQMQRSLINGHPFFNRF